MTAKTSAGSTLAISASLPATYNQAGFAALSFTELGEVTNIAGNLGRTYNKVEHKPLKTRGTQKLKGGYDSGSLTVDLAIDQADAGQTIARAALVSNNKYSFVLTEQDGTLRYFTGLVMAFPPTVGNVDSVESGTITIEVTDNNGVDYVVV